jgi:CRISPR-associated protein Csx17
MLENSKDSRTVQDLLIAFGKAVYAIALRPKLQEALRPPPQLSRIWIEAADDGSPEFRVAVALAGMRARMKVADGDGADKAEEAGRSPQRVGLPMRTHLAPLDPDTVMRAPAWALKQQRAGEGRALAVWGAGRLVDNLCVVAQRRLLEQTRNGWWDAPFDGSFDDKGNVSVAVDSGEIVAFLNNEVRDERIAALLLGLAWVQPGLWLGCRQARSLPFAYAAIKPLFTPRWILRRLNGDICSLPMPPALPSLLTTGRIQEAVQLAQERARASGLRTPFIERRRSRGRTADLNLGRRLLAALTIPVQVNVVGACLDQVYPRSDEESPHAA